MKNEKIETLPQTKPTSQAFKLCVALYEKGQIPEAVQAYQTLLKTEPENAAAWLNLGAILRQQGHLEASAACCKRALELTPDKAVFLTNLGNCLVAMDRMEEAIEAHAEAARLKPDTFLIRSNYAIALREFGKPEQALVEFDVACAMQPDNDVVKWERALTLMDMARFEEGWEAFEVRWKQKQMKSRVYNAPQWQGEDLTGKTIFIYEEQGFGDTILCTRFIPLVKARGARVLFECKVQLHRLFKSVPGIDMMVEHGKLQEPFDYHIPLMSLPRIFGTRLNNIPPIAPMFVPPAPPPEAKRLLDLHKERFRVGIIWSGSVTFARNRKRAVSADRFLPLAEIPGVQLYSLQKGPCEPELAACGGQGLVLEMGPLVNDFADTAAVLKNLDLVIMTDSSVAHLAGSVGCPIWDLLCYRPYWLYLSEREDSPWYPSMRLIRQKAPGDWDDVFKRVTVELQKAVEMKKAGKWPVLTKVA